METRLIIAYLLIAVLLAGAMFAARSIIRRRREYQREMMRGHKLDIVADRANTRPR